MQNGQINLTIDGLDISVSKGTTVLQAARQAGIDIPHLCYEPELGLPPSASCRLCVVEVEGAATPVASCAHPAMPGMVIRTDTEDLREIRGTVLELLLSDHPHDCATCDESGDCLLEEYAYQLGVREKAVTERGVSAMNCLNTHPEPQQDTPPLVYDRTKCVLCGRCVAVCQQVQGISAVDFSGRGFDTEISLPPNLSREDSVCELCGNCAAVCTTGATRAARMPGLRDASKVRTTCGYCGVGCQFDINVLNGRVAGVTSSGDNPVNGKWLCVKGRFGYEFIHHQDRLTHPLIRRNGNLEPASWDEALDYVASGLLKTKWEHGPDSIGFISSGRCTNEENYLVQKMARAVIGTNNVDQCART